MSTPDRVWAVGRVTLAPLVQVSARLRVYGRERVPLSGGLVVASNHFSWLDPAAVGAACPRTIHYMAKVEAHRAPGLGQLIRAFGCFPVRRGESDREAVRTMKEVVRAGLALGLFVEGTRQMSGVPGEVLPGAAMVAIQEGVPVVPVAVHGSQTWRVGNFHPVSVAWGEPFTLDGLPAGGRGYKEGSRVIGEEIMCLWRFLVEQHEGGRPPGAVPPGRCT